MKRRKSRLFEIASKRTEPDNIKEFQQETMNYIDREDIIANLTSGLESRTSENTNEGKTERITQDEWNEMSGYKKYF